MDPVHAIGAKVHYAEARPVLQGLSYLRRPNVLAGYGSLERGWCDRQVGILQVSDGLIDNVQGVR